MISHLTLEVERFYLSPTKDSYGNFMIAKMTLLLFGFLHLSFLQPGMKDIVKVDLQEMMMMMYKMGKLDDVEENLEDLEKKL